MRQIPIILTAAVLLASLAPAADTVGAALPPLPPFPSLPAAQPVDSVPMADSKSAPEVKLDLPIIPGPYAPTWESIEKNHPGTPAYQNHLRDYGHPSESGYKEVLRDWNPTKLDPAKLVDLYKDAGARFLIIQGVPPSEPRSVSKSKRNKRGAGVSDLGLARSALRNWGLEMGQVVCQSPSFDSCPTR